MSNNIEKLKSLACKEGEAFEIYLLNKEYISVGYENNKLKEISNEENTGIALKLVVDGKIGFSTTSKENDFNGLIERAKRTSKYGKKLEYTLPCTALDHYDEKGDFTPDIDSMIFKGEDIISSIVKSDPDILGFAGITACRASCHLINSNEANGSYLKNIYSIYGGGKYTEEGNLLYVYDSVHSTKSFEDYEILKRYIADSFNIAKKNVSITSGRYNVILSPSAATDLLVPIIVCSNGKNIQTGVSPWVKSLGKLIFDKRITVIDDGLIDDGIATFPFDDEGIKTGRTRIIDRGVISGFYHSLSTARATMSEPTGNGFKGGSNIFRRVITANQYPSLTNVIMTGGDIKNKDILKEVKDGIFIDQLLGTFTSNHLSGQVSGNISLGYKIENGEKVGRIKNATISVDVLEVLKNNLIGLSEELVRKGNISLPHILLSDINITC